MEILIEKLGGYGIGGVVLAYFLWNDYQDRKAFRDEIRNNRLQLQDHEVRICVMEKEK